MIPGVVTVHPRESWQDPSYPVFGPADNPADNDTVVIHYTAADDLIDGDPGESADDLPAYMRAMQKSYVVNRGYSLGYLFAVDWLGGVWQIRGWEFQSAANAGHNTHTWPVLMLVDGADMATDEAVASVRAIVAEAGRRAGRSQVIKGHGQLRVETGVGTATACPGVGLQAQINAGVFAPRPEPTPPFPPSISTPEGAPAMFAVIVTNAPSSTVRETWLLCDGTQLSHMVDGHAAALFMGLEGFQVVRPANADQTAGLIKSCRTMNDCPPEWVGSAWQSTWEASAA